MKTQKKKSQKPKSSQTIKAYSTEVSKLKPTVDNKYIQQPFYDFGSDNNFPVAVNELLRKSPILRGGINSKSTYSLGSGFKTEDESLKTFLKKVNSNNESLDKIYKRLIKDDWGGGNAYIEVVTTPATNGLSLYHRDWSTGRVGKGLLKDHILFLDNWTNWQSNKEHIVELPIYPEFKRIGLNNHSVIHIKDYESGFKRYGVMDWIAGLNAGAIGYMTDEWNVSRLENDMRPSGVIVAHVESQQEADKLQEYYDKEMRGKSNAGKVMFVTTNGDGRSSFTPLQDTSDGNWLQLRNSSREDIVRSLNWWDVLMGGETKGQLGNTQQIRNVWSLAIKNVIQPKQNDYLEIFKELIETHTGINTEDLAINNANPVGYADLIDFNSLLTKEQAFEMTMIPFDPDRSDLTNTINGTKTDGSITDTDTSK